MSSEEGRSTHDPRRGGGEIQGRRPGAIQYLEEHKNEYMGTRTPRRVVFTGMGVVTALAISLRKVLAASCAGQAVLRPGPSETTEIPVHSGGGR